MPSRAWLRSALPLAASGLLLVTASFQLGACTTDYQKGLDDPRLGGPNALSGESPPDPPTGPNSVECVNAGETLVEAGACEVSFAKDVLGIFENSTCASTGCHGGGPNPSNVPAIDPKDPNAAWAVFAAFRISNGTLYINPCSTDKTKSAIACNLNSTNCGARMPQAAPDIPAEDVAKIEKWLECGSPNN